MGPTATGHPGGFIAKGKGREEGHAPGSQGRKFQITECFLSGSLSHSDIILRFQGSVSRGNYWVLFYLGASWFQLIFYRMREEGNTETMFAPEE